MCSTESLIQEDVYVYSYGGRFITTFATQTNIGQVRRTPTAIVVIDMSSWDFRDVREATSQEERTEPNQEQNKE
ncbi:hypothetical protein CHS0354_012405 [Potamilus streckersoni]|uniref:Uncharacterized protein n=1 Tax=Potamilus streckersoni TaxID=2493646 RepID=A0AAE0RYK2_9BIVA|nr:hypothetical protein CHS0354_012405 [Potamilus streckersoni]